MSNSAGSRANLKTALDRLQKTVTEQRQTIDKLRQENKNLKSDLENAKKSVNNNNSQKQKPKPSNDDGVEKGPSQGAAANALAGLFGGKVKGKKGKNVEKGPGRAAAANLLAGKLGGTVKKGAGSGGVEKGPGRAAAAGLLAGKLGKNKDPPKPTSNGSAKKSNSGKADNAEYAKIFKKYETMMKLGINVHGAVGRMRQEGVDKKIIDAFYAKHDKKEEKKEVSWEDIGLTPKKEVNVSNNVKMKRLHWETLAPKYVLNSIWEKLDVDSIDYEPEKFELKFQVKQRKPDTNSNNKNGGNKSEKKQHDGEIKLFVSKKRSQQVQIGLKGLGLTNKQIRKALMDMDEKKMNPDLLAKLMDVAPSMDEQTETEKNIITNGTGNPEHYGLVEQFFYSLYDFYNLNQRLKLWMFKQTFDEIQDSLLSQYKSVEIACTKVRTNKELKQLFTIILAFGNHMNAQTRKGRAYGFNLKILSQLSQVKSMDSSTSFLMYLYQFCDSKYPRIIDSMTELSKTLKGAASMEMEVLKTAYSRIKDNMLQIKNLVTSDEIENYDMDDRFINVMNKFNKSASPLMKKFNSTVKNVITSTNRLLKKFAFGTEEEPQTIEALFKLLYGFCLDFEKARDKLIKLEKERQKKLAARRKEKEKKKKLGGNNNKSMSAKKKQIKGVFGKKILPTSPPPSRRSPSANNESKEDEKDEDLETPLLKGNNLQKKIAQKIDFEKKVSKHKRKLTMHIKDRSKFVKTGGGGDMANKNETMRRISSMYQNDMDQISAIEDARKKAAMLRFNKFKLPDLPGRSPQASPATSVLMRNRNINKNGIGILSDKEAGLADNEDPRNRKGTGYFPETSSVPDDQPLMAPPPKKRGGGSRNASKNFNIPSSSPTPNNNDTKPNLSSPITSPNSSFSSKKKRKSKSKKGVPPPPTNAPPKELPTSKKFNTKKMKPLPSKAVPGPPPMKNGGQMNDPHNAFIKQNQMGLNISNHNFAMANQINPNQSMRFQPPNNNNGKNNNNNPHYQAWLQQQNRYWQQQQQYWQQQQNLALNNFNRPSPGSHWAANNNNKKK